MSCCNGGPWATGVAQYVISRSLNGGAWVPVGVQRAGVTRYVDWIGNPHARAAYRVTARTSALAESAPSNEASAATHPMNDDELLTMVQDASFHYYWDAAEPVSGMARESQPGNDDMIALGASGFGIMAMIVAAERGFVPREAAVERMLKITRFLERADRFHGAWGHFISGRTGHVIPLFQIYDDGADLVETSFLMQGLLAARGYYTRDTPAERELRARITRLWEGVDWDWFRATPKRDALYWHWSPNYGWYDPLPTRRLERGDDHLPAGGRIADAPRAAFDSTTRDTPATTGRILWHAANLFWFNHNPELYLAHQEFAGKHWSAILHPLFVPRLRPPRGSRPVQQLLRQQPSARPHQPGLLDRQPK